MPNFADASGLVAGLRAASPLRNFNKVSAATEGIGTWHSLWRVAGFPGAGAKPPLFTAGSGYTPTKGTVGAYPFTNTVLPAKNALAKFSTTQSIAGTIIVYDRIWACSGFGTVVITAQAVTTPGTLPAARDPNGGQDVEPWGEVYTAPGATAAIWTITGVDSLGNAGRTWVYSHPANTESVGKMFPFLPSGAAPASTATIRQVTSLTCSVSTGTAGDIGITLLRRLGTASAIAANISAVQDAFATGLPEVPDDACLAMMMQCTTTATGQVLGELVVANN